ncbi:c-type cytochrome [Shumkonia mesophila]|uniref:c-type cytochrome n=1 Tax=Shumkonia mesophila TaxID=2838854 RepID=UPI0029346761|nr:c-type cytochrome [Shumkonia mesophila]
MSRFLDFAAAALMAGVLLAAPQARADGDPAKGEKVFKVCVACHAIGDGAKTKTGPHLNDVVGRTAGSIEGFKYSPAMSQAGSQGVVWSEERLAAFLASPRKVIKGTKMTFAGLKKESDLTDVIAYLKSAGPGKEAASQAAPPSSVQPRQVAAAPQAAGSPPQTVLSRHGVFHLGRPASADEIAAWDIDIRPDGEGLPEGKGTVAEGEVLFAERCASCHGDFGEGRDRWPVLAGGFGTLTAERPEKTIGSYWPYLSTVYDYVRRAMPFGDAHSLGNDDVYALTAYLLYLNDVVTDTDFELSKANFASIRLPNQIHFIDDDRAAEPHAAKRDPCMTDCKADARIVSRARILDVTPDDEGDGGQIE